MATKMPKLPKSMGACADLLFDVRSRRLETDKLAAELKAQEELIKNHIIDNLDKRDETGAAGKHHRVQVVRKRKYRCDPTMWDKFYAWVAKNRRFDLLQKRLSDVAVKELVEEGKKKVPGIEPFDYVDVSLTKV
jgi:hypothetical protein